MPTNSLWPVSSCMHSVPFAEHCLRDTVAYTKGKNKGGQNQNWLQSEVQKEKWPTSGQGGYITPAARGVPTAVERGGQNQRWPTGGQDGYIAPAAKKPPPVQSGGAESEGAHKWARWLLNPCRLRVPAASEQRTESKVAHKWAR